MLSLALPLMVAIAPATTFSTVEISDGSCLAAFSLLASTGDKEKVNAALPGAYYFIGKLFARNTTLELTTLLRLVAPDVKRNYAGELQRCSAEVRVKAEALIASGQALSADGI